MPFLVQTVLIHRMGMQYVGVQGVFRSVLSVLNVAELGFGSAIVYSMYKPIAYDDMETVCSLLGFYRKAYHVIGFIILFCGLAVLPFVHIIVSDNDMEENLYIIFLLYLSNTVLSYFLFAYKTSLLTAYQRTDVISNIGMAISICMSLIQIALLMLFKNFYMFLIIAIIFTVVRNIMVSIIVDHLYPELKCSGTISAQLFSDIKTKAKGVFITKVCHVTRNAFDSIFVSSFLGVVVAGIYSNYYYVMNAVIEMLSIVTPALLGGIGNSIQLETREKNYEDMRKINCIYMMISGWCSVCLLCLYQPFMKLWAGEKNLFSFDVIVLFVVYFFVRQMGNIRAIYSDAAGLFWENRYRTLAEAIANIILNYVFVIRFGVKGIVGATIISLFIFGFFGSAEVAFRCYFKTGMLKYILDSMRYLLETAMVAGIVYGICGLIHFSGYLELFVKLCICVFISPFFFLIFIHLSKQDRNAVEWFISTVLQKSAWFKPPFKNIHQ